jgi:precorrin-2 dehydrogenase/sirohydrochlorin ferrochelatase
MSKYYPVCLDIKGRKCLVVGGGRVAERKVKGLLASYGQVTVISPELTENLLTLVDQGHVVWQKKCYQHGDLKDFFLVIAATDDRTVQVGVYSEAEQFGILLNVADVPEKCNFILPALVNRGDLTIAVSTSGKSPALAKQLRQELEKGFGPEYSKLADILGLIRPVVLARGLSQKENEDLFNRVLATEIRGWLLVHDWQNIQSVILAECGAEFNEETLHKIKSIVFE